MVSILNSRLGWFLITSYCTAINNGYQLISDYLGKIPIVIPDEKQKGQLEKHENDAELETLNQVVYDLYQLTDEESKLIESVTQDFYERLLRADSNELEMEDIVDA